MKKTYLCTAIPYANGKPHAGHALDYLLADVYARYRRSLGDEVRMQAGTDEHGNKIYGKAVANNRDAEEYAGEISEQFRSFIDRLKVTYTDFIRTTDKDHVRRCQEIWRRLEKHIYKADYDGWYCEGCERFVTEKEYEENHGVCPDHQTQYQKLTESNYYFRVADFREQIQKKIEDDEMQILPEFRKQEMLKLLEDTPDISISRPKKTLSWGVPVPGDDEQVMYVWIDALSNYITVLGYPDQDISDFWPADLQVVGKDILRFHTIMWPAMLLGLGLPLPKRILSHGFILANGQKMSKSIGNVIDPVEVLDKHGLDAFRYYFLRHVDTFMDSDFTWEKFENAYNLELANDLGNLVQRLATLCKKNEVGGQEIAVTQDKKYTELMDDLEFAKAFDYAWEKIQDLNKAIDTQKPWELAKQGKIDEAKSVLSQLVSDLLVANQLILPFLPTASAKIAEIFTAESILPPTTPLFPKER